MGIEWAGPIFRVAAEVATAGAFAAGVWEAVTGARAKFRARRIAEHQLSTPRRETADRAAVDEVLAHLSGADRAKVLQGLKQRNTAAAKRYFDDIFPTVLRSD